MNRATLENLDRQPTIEFYEPLAIPAISLHAKEATPDNKGLSRLVGELDARKGIRRFGILLAQNGPGGGVLQPDGTLDPAFLKTYQKVMKETQGDAQRALEKWNKPFRNATENEKKEARGQAVVGAISDILIPEAITAAGVAARTVDRLENAKTEKDKKEAWENSLIEGASAVVGIVSPAAKGFITVIKAMDDWHLAEITPTNPNETRREAVSRGVREFQQATDQQRVLRERTAAESAQRHREINAAPRQWNPNSGNTSGQTNNVPDDRISRWDRDIRGNVDPQIRPGLEAVGDIMRAKELIDAVASGRPVNVESRVGRIDDPCAIVSGTGGAPRTVNNSRGTSSSGGSSGSAPTSKSPSKPSPSKSGSDKDGPDKDKSDKPGDDNGSGVRGKIDWY